jgi:hypothetical protein
MATRLVELTKPVGRLATVQVGEHPVGLGFHCTTELGTKPDPVTVRLNEGFPGTVLEGLRVEMERDVRVKPVNVADDPLGLGFITTMSGVPAVVRSLAGTVAWRSLPSMKVVARAEPFHSTCAVEAKFVPVTRMVVCGLPAGIDEDPLAVTVEIVGGAAVTVRVGDAATATDPLQRVPLNSAIPSKVSVLLVLDSGICDPGTARTKLPPPIPLVRE